MCLFSFPLLFFSSLFTLFCSYSHCSKVTHMEKKKSRGAIRTEFELKTIHFTVLTTWNLKYCVAERSTDVSMITIVISLSWSKAPVLVMQTQAARKRLPGFEVNFCSVQAVA